MMPRRTPRGSPGELEQRIERDEQRALARVAEIFGFTDLRIESDAGIGHADGLFAERSWRVFGLSKAQLTATAAVGGAVVGGGVDLAVGGLSALLGSGIGATLGAASVWLGGNRMAKHRLFKRHAGATLRVGPIRDPNFPWVLLGRAWFHFQLVAERNHARRDALRLIVGAGRLMTGLDRDARFALTREFARLRKGGEIASMVKLLTGVLERPIDKSD